MLQLTDIQPIPIKEMIEGIDPESEAFGTECHFESGKNYLITAPSGKGKTTLLHILYGLRADYEGVVTFDGQNIRDLSPDDWADFRQTKLSIVFQDLRLFPNLSALENILLKAHLGNAKSEDSVREMAAHMGIEPLLDQKAGSLSYGQKQRVAIIRALCQPFEFLLLDEPFSHLDEENSRNASGLILEECEALEAGIIMVSLGKKYHFEYHEEMVL